MMREIEAIRDRIMGMCGTERLIESGADEQPVMRVTRQWRKPLSIEEVARISDARGAGT